MKAAKKSNTLLIIPAYNEAWNIQNAIYSLTKNGEDWDVLVINDASTDDTGILAEATQKALVVHLPYHLGIGGCVQTGFKFAKMYGYEYALQFDGDGQHLAHEVSTILEPVKNGEADVVIGSRFCEKNSGFRSNYMRRIGIRIFRVVSSILINQNIYDHTSGFRAFNKNAIHCLSMEYPCDYPEPEAIVLLGKNGFSIKEVYTEMQPRRGGVSSISRHGGWFYMSRVLLGMFMTSIRPKLNMNE